MTPEPRRPVESLDAFEVEAGDKRVEEEPAVGAVGGGAVGGARLRGGCRRRVPVPLERRAVPALPKALRRKQAKKRSSNKMKEGKMWKKKRSLDKTAKV